MTTIHLPDGPMAFMRGFGDLLENSNWGNVEPRMIDHTVHLMLDQLLRKVIKDNIGVIAHGGGVPHKPYSWPVDVLYCLAHGKRYCEICNSR